MKRIVSLLLFIVLCFGTSGCFLLPMTSDDPDAWMEYTIIKSSETRVEIYVSGLGDWGWKLIDLMERAKADEELTYEISGGMVTSIEGKDNAADFSSCWMLYTSDAEMSNTEWGTIQVGEKTFGSAIVGAEALLLVEGEYYVWDYFTFWDY